MHFTEKGGKNVMKVIYKLFTNQGNRENNEDYVGERQCSECSCFALADGLGGHGRGELASQLVVKETLDMFHSTKDLENFLQKAFSTSQEKLLKYQKKEKAENEMKTTEVILVIGENEIQWGHIGDSRLYYFKGNRLMKQTYDHSVPQMLVSSGEIKEKDIRHHPDRNRVLRVMGTQWTVPKYELAKKIKKKKNQSFLLCTDGFWELIDEKQMIQFLKEAVSPEEWISKMEQKILENGENLNMDNFSAIAVWIR